MIVSHHVKSGHITIFEDPRVLDCGGSCKVGQAEAGQAPAGQSSIMDETISHWLGTIISTRYIQETKNSMALEDHDNHNVRVTKRSRLS